MEDNFIDVIKALGISEDTAQVAAPPVAQEHTPRFVRLEQDKKDLDRMRKYISRQAQNTTISQSLRVDITKGILQGEPLYNLLLKAVECISLMTGDSLFYNENKEQLKTLHIALDHKPAMEAELIEIETRIDKINAFKKENPIAAGEAIRLDAALKWHKEKVVAIKKQMEA